MLACKKSLLFSYDLEAPQYNSEENEDDIEIVRSLLFQMQLILGPYPYDAMAKHFRNKFVFDAHGKLILPKNKSNLERAIRKMKGYTTFKCDAFFKICKNLFNKKLVGTSWFEWALIVKKKLVYEPCDRF